MSEGIRTDDGSEVTRVFRGESGSRSTGTGWVHWVYPEDGYLVRTRDGFQAYLSDSDLDRARRRRMELPLG